MSGRNIVLNTDEPVVGVGRPIKRIRVRVNNVIVPIDDILVFDTFILVQLQDAVTSGDDVEAQYNPELVRPVVNGIIAVDNAEELKAFTLTLAQIPIGQVEVDASIVLTAFVAPAGQVIASVFVEVKQHGQVLANVSLGSKVAGQGEVTVGVSINAAQHGTAIVINSSINAAQNAAVQSIATIDLSQNGAVQIAATIAAEKIAGTVQVDVTMDVHKPAQVQIGASIGALQTGEVQLAMAVEVLQNGAVQVTASMGVEAGLVYVVDSLDNIVKVFRRVGLTPVLPDITVGTAPLHIAVLDDFTRAWVLNFTTNNVTELDLAGQVAVGSTSLAPQSSSPVRILLHPNQTEYWICSRSGGGHVHVRGVDNVFITTISLGNNVRSLAFTSDGLKCYVTNDNASQVFVIDAVARTLTATIITGMVASPRGIAVSPDDSKVYAFGQINRDIAVIATATDTVVATIAIPSFGGSGAKRGNVVFHPNGLFAYIGDQDAAIIHEIDAVTDAVTGRTIAVAANPRGLVISEDGSKLFVATEAVGNTVQVIDTASMTIDSSVAGLTSPLELGLGNQL